MGKVREMRFRVHANALKKALSRSENNFPSELPGTTSPNINIGPNIFAGIDIDVNALSQNLPDKSDTQSISGKSHRDIKNEEQHLPKKEKLKRRHERFMEKLDAFYKSKKKQNKKSKKKTQKHEDNAPLLELLSDDDLPVPKINKKKKNIPRASMKLKKRLQEDLKDVKQFRKVLDDSVFRRNPGEAIKQLLLQKIAEKRPDLNLT